MFFLCFYLILQSRYDKMGVIFAYVRKNIYLCRLFMLSKHPHIEDNEKKRKE